MKRNRKVSINDKFIVECNESESIYQVLTDSGFTFLGHCGGKGICGKCCVKIQIPCKTSKELYLFAGDENTGTTLRDHHVDMKEETVLACQYSIRNDISVYTGDLWQYIGNHNTEHKASMEALIAKTEKRQTGSRIRINRKQL